MTFDPEAPQTPAAIGRLGLYVETADAAAAPDLGVRFAVLDAAGAVLRQRQVPHARVFAELTTQERNGLASLMAKLRTLAEGTLP